ncbi:MAG: DnaJ domain-containing protein [Lachnospiraceae bacterium]|nr:DnaJ domain-containing protein [Lachnospiraceae bacterium]
MQDPYEVLGVSRDDSIEKIKRAYRTLSRKYHPDANMNNPNKAQAEEKFKQIQQAYKQIIDEIETDTFSGTYESGSYGYGNDVKLQAVANYINNGHYMEAMNILNNISNRNGTWYYLHALANAGMGNNVNALEDAQIAVNLEPENLQFQRLLQSLSRNSEWYSNIGGNYDICNCEEGKMSKVCCYCCMIRSLCNGSCCPYGSCRPYGKVCCF